MGISKIRSWLRIWENCDWVEISRKRENSDKLILRWICSSEKNPRKVNFLNKLYWNHQNYWGLWICLARTLSDTRSSHWPLRGQCSDLVLERRELSWKYRTSQTVPWTVCSVLVHSKEEVRAALARRSWVTFKSEIWMFLTRSIRNPNGWDSVHKEIKDFLVHFVSQPCYISPSCSWPWSSKNTFTALAAHSNEQVRKILRSFSLATWSLKGWNQKSQRMHTRSQV